MKGLERYVELIKKLLEIRSEEDDILNEMDKVWEEMSVDERELASIYIIKVNNKEERVSDES